MTSPCADFNDTVGLDTLLRHVMPVVNNIPYELGVDLLRNSFTKFCQKTQLLATLQNLMPQADVADYELVAPDGYDVYLIREAGYSGQYITLPQANYWYVSYGTRFSIVSNKYIILKDIPQADSLNPFCVITTLVPNECVKRIPREISVPYGNDIAKGAIAEALMFKNKSWYDPNLAGKFERDFNVAINSGKNLQITNRGAADMRMKGRRWV